MDATLMFHFAMIGLVAGSMLACGICAIAEAYLASDYHRQHKRAARHNRRAKAFLKRERQRAQLRALHQANAQGDIKYFR